MNIFQKFKVDLMDQLLTTHAPNYVVQMYMSFHFGNEKCFFLECTLHENL